MILGLEHRQHRLAAGGGPTAEHDGNLVLIDQLGGLLSEGGPIGSAVLLHGNDLQLLAVDGDATFGIDLIDGHQLGFGHRVFGDGHGAGAAVKDAHLHFAIEITAGFVSTPAGHE